ncbi:hypothetical protein [Agromyces seonyuensis]|uniref:hypothetical protein n=1 Tax=Agromyces seonyuensis TaxID=2662446 RepID=UPI00301464C1
MHTDVAVSTVLSELELGEAFTFDQLTAASERRRRRPIRIVEIEGLGKEAGLCAAVLLHEQIDLVVHQPTDSVLHRQQFVLHEIAHLLLGHLEAQDDDEPDFLLPDIPAATRRRLLRRQDPDSPHEIAAESLADRFAAGIRRAARHDDRFVEIFG